MKSRWIALTLVAALPALIALGLLTGCETNSDVTGNDGEDGTAVGVSPTSVTLSTNDVFEIFTAVDGLAPFTWTMSDATLATMSTTDADSTDEGRYVTYTPIADAEGINTIQVMDARGDSAHATVLHSFE